MGSLVSFSTCDSDFKRGFEKPKPKPVPISRSLFRNLFPDSAYGDFKIYSNLLRIDPVGDSKEED